MVTILVPGLLITIVMIPVLTSILGFDVYDRLFCPV